MKKYLSFPLIALLLLTTFVFIGCSAKETAPTPATAETLSQQDQEKTDGSDAPEAELRDKPHSPEAEMVDKARSAEADTGDKSSSPEAELKDKPHSPEAETADKPRSPEAELKDKPHSPEAETADKPHSPEQEIHPETKPEEAIPTTQIPEESVLHLIPEQAIGLIYCPSLLELDYRINTLVTDLMPTAENPEILAKVLAQSFGAGFESLAELEEIGLDLNQDFAVFMTALQPADISATVHLTDPAAMKQVIAAESEGSAPTEYNGETYWSATGADGHFAILENTLVFSQSSEVCESAIDAYKGTKQSVVTNPDYGTFLADIVAGEAQLAVHFNLESIAPLMITSLKRESESMRDSVESDPSVMAVAPFLESMFSTAIDLLEQSESLSATLEVKGTDVQLAPSLKFKNGSEIHQFLKNMIPDELAILNDLPNLAFMNGAYQMDPKILVNMNMVWLKMFSTGIPEHQEKIDALTQQITAFYESLADQLGFSVSFSDSVIPDYLVVYGVKDKQQAQAYMENMFLEQFHLTMRIMREVFGDTPGLNIYDGAHIGASVMHNDVEIKSFIFPNFGSVFEQVPPEAAGLFPEEWYWYYAFHEDQLFFATGSTELIRAALDRKSGMGDGLAENPSYQKLIGTLGTDNNVFFALSPITMVKDLMPILSKADPNAAAAMQMFTGMLMNVPENYSLGFSAKVQEDKIGTKLLLTLGDFKQVIQMIMMMQGMGQM